MSKTRNTGNLVSENNIFVDVTNDRVGIGSTQPTAKLDGDGSNLSGINASGGGDFATALSSTAPLSSFYKVPKLLEIGTGKNITVQSDSDSDNKAYIRQNGIRVGSGSTVHIADGTTLIVDVLNLFE